MTNPQAKIQELQRLVFQQQNEIDQLKELHFEELPRLKLLFKLRRLEYRLFQHLMRREFVRKDIIMSVMYFDRHIDEWPVEKSVDVCLFKLRKKLKPFGFEIKTSWGDGVYIEEATKQELRALENEQARAAA